MEKLIVESFLKNTTSSTTKIKSLYKWKLSKCIITGKHSSNYNYKACLRSYAI